MKPYLRICALLTLATCAPAFAACVPADVDEAFAPGAAAVAGLNPDTACAGQPLGTGCTDDGNDCTHDVCDGNGNCNIPVGVGKDCDDTDDNECTKGVCDGKGSCLPKAVADGTECNDGDDNDCTDGVCQAGRCEVENTDAGTACKGPNANEPCVDDKCDGKGACVPTNTAEGTDCFDADTMNVCHDAACDGEGQCVETNKKKGAVCKPKKLSICHKYSCMEKGNDMVCEGTCDVGIECTTTSGTGKCMEPAAGKCGCYGPQGACFGLASDPLCMSADQCTGGEQCSSGSACVIQAPATATGPWAFTCEPCADGQCPPEDFNMLLLVDASESYPSPQDCETADAQGAYTLLVTLREQLVAEARALCGSNNVDVMALSDQSYSWQCGGYEGASADTLYGEAAGFAVCLD